MKRQDWSNIGSPLTWNVWREPSVLTRLKAKSRNGCRSAIMACSFSRSASFQPAAPASFLAPARESTRMPSISSTGPDTLVKFPASSCSQYQSEASSVRLRKRASLSRSSAVRSRTVSSSTLL